MITPQYNKKTRDERYFLILECIPKVKVPKAKVSQLSQLNWHLLDIRVGKHFPSSSMLDFEFIQSFLPFCQMFLVLMRGCTVPREGFVLLTCRGYVNGTIAHLFFYSVFSPPTSCSSSFSLSL